MYWASMDVRCTVPLLDVHCTASCTALLAQQYRASLQVIVQLDVKPMVELVVNVGVFEVATSGRQTKP